MAHLGDLPKRTRASVEALSCPKFSTTPFASGPDLSQRRLAVISTAGLHHQHDRPFALNASDYREIAHPNTANDIRMTHLSINYDRSGFYQDLNVVLPLDRLDEMAAAGALGSLSHRHFSFMGATDPTLMEGAANQVAGLLKADQVDAVLLVPV